MKKPNVSIKSVKMVNGLPEFTVIIRPTTWKGLLYWGIGQTDDIRNLTHVNEDFKGLNRDAVQPHKGVVGKAIMKNGFAGGIAVVIYKNKLYRIDGNHRAEYLGDSKYPIRFSYRYVETFEELVSIMIEFNDSAKNWKLERYISTYASTGSEAYTLIQKLSKEQGITPSCTAALIANVPIGTAKTQIRRGTLKLNGSNDAATERVTQAALFLEAFGQKDQRSAEGFIRFIRTIPFVEFIAISKKLAKRAYKLRHEENFFISKGTADAKDFDELFTEAYRTI
jgi:hypothetical protein